MFNPGDKVRLLNGRYRGLEGTYVRGSAEYWKFKPDDCKQADRQLGFKVSRETWTMYSDTHSAELLDDSKSFIPEDWS